ATSALMVVRAASGSSTNGAVATAPEGHSATTSVKPGFTSNRRHTHNVLDTANVGSSCPLAGASSTAAARNRSACSDTRSGAPANSAAGWEAVSPLAARVTSPNAPATEYGEKHALPLGEPDARCTARAKFR